MNRPIIAISAINRIADGSRVFAGFGQVIASKQLTLKFRIFDPYFKKSFVRLNPNFGLAPAPHITRTLAHLHRVHPDNPFSFIKRKKRPEV
jgi:hypothetical protein